MLTNCTKTLLDAPIVHKPGECNASENTVLVSYDVFGRAKFLKDVFENIESPRGIGAFEGNRRNNFSGEVIYGNKNIGWPEAIAEFNCVIDTTLKMISLFVVILAP